MSNAAHRLPQLTLNDRNLPGLIVLGRDDANKPHAAWFDHSEAEAASSAAVLMAMMALPVTSDELIALAGRLPRGKIFNGSGRAFLPFTKQTTYDELIAHVPLDQQVRPLRIVRSEGDSQESRSSDQPTQPGGKHDGTTLTLPLDWLKVGPGCIVLAVADDPSEGWFEAVILKAKGTTYTCRWMHYPAEPHFERAQIDIAIMHHTRKVNG